MSQFPGLWARGSIRCIILSVGIATFHVLASCQKACAAFVVLVWVDWQSANLLTMTVLDSGMLLSVLGTHRYDEQALSEVAATAFLRSKSFCGFLCPCWCCCSSHYIDGLLLWLFSRMAEMAVDWRWTCRWRFRRIRWALCSSQRMNVTWCPWTL